MRVCIVGTGDGGSTAAIQIRRLDSEAQIDIFSKRASLGCPPCEMPLVIGGTVTTWDELIRGFRKDSFWEKRNVVVHLNTEVTDIDRVGKCIIAGGKKYNYDRLILALGAAPVMPFVTKVFGRQIGAVGFTEKETRDKGLEAVSVAVDTPRLRERFDGRPTHYKLIADAKTKTLIGAQIVSEEIVSGTIDKLAVAIACRMPLVKLVQIDSCYSPHVQEDQLAVPLHRLLDKLGSGDC